jgi:serine/alanine adding enzyme
MEVVLLTPDREEAWKQFVDTSSQATLGHLLGWRNVVQKTYHHIPYYLMAIDRETIRGVLPLFFIRSPVFGRLLVTAPYLSYGGLLEDHGSAGDSLIAKAVQIGQAQRAKYVEVRGRERIGRELIVKEKYCTFILSLQIGPDGIWKRFEGGKVRRAVRKALKAGLIVERGCHLKKVFADVMSRHMRDLGTPSHRLRFYQSIAEEFPHHSEILMARYDNHYVGGVLVISFQDTAYWLCGAGLREYRSLAPMSLLLWEAIRSACESGLSYFDFGRSQWESGTFHFKRKWGAQPLQLFYEYSLLTSGGLPDIDPTNPHFGLAIALWKRLPVCVTKALGPWIIKDIP